VATESVLTLRLAPTAKGSAAALVDMATDEAPSGDIRVLLVLDLLLSLLFSVGAVYALDIAGIGEYTWRNVALATLFLTVVTYVAVLRE